MTIVLVGLNHRTAPVELREQFYLADGPLQVALEALHGKELSEVVILSTCNRLEVAGSTEQAESAFAVIETFLAHSHDISREELRSHLYFIEGRAAVEHLMRVASGLESLVLGETQIMRQVANAVAFAESTDGPILARLFSAALHTGKRARTETAISQHTLSVSHTAALLVKQQIDKRQQDVSQVRALVIGAGEMAELAARALQRHGVSSLSVINRTQAKAQALAERLDIQALAWQDRQEALRRADVVITATSAPQPIINVDDIAPELLERRQHPLLLVDIGVPRNVDEKVSALPGVQLYDIDDLQSVVEEHRSRRQAEIAPVEVIIAQELDSYMQWLETRRVAPLITELRRQAEALAQAEVEQALKRMPDLQPHEQEIVAQMAHRIVNKMLHAPTVTLKARVARGDHYDYAHAVRQLFALDIDTADQRVDKKPVSDE